MAGRDGNAAPAAVVRSMPDRSSRFPPGAPQIASTCKYKPPRHDVNSPDLYIPTMALFSWVLACGLRMVAKGAF